MAGLSFVTTGFLVAGAVAAAIPILIHLLLKQRAREVPIGTVRFLENVIRQHRRRQRVRQWILLAMRMLAILLLAMLFARPYWDRSHLRGLNREVVILLDQSASMRFRSEDADTAFEEGLAVAKRELASLDDNTVVHVALFDASGVSQTDVTKLDEAQPNYAATDYGFALSWARDVMSASSRPSRKVVLISDMQRGGLGRTEMSDFPADIDVVLRDVGQTMARNVSIVTATAVATAIRPKEPVRLEVTVRNAGAIAETEIPVELQLDGPSGPIRESQTIDLAGGAVESLYFELPSITEDGVYRGHVDITLDDDLPFDNRRWVALEARRPDRILLVDGQQGRSVYSNETYYLETALRLRSPVSAAPLRSFEVERIVWEDGDGFPNLSGHRAVVIANIGRLTSADAQRLKEYIDAGGNVLFFLGNQTRNSFMSRLNQVGLFPARVINEPAIGPWRIDDWQRAHPILEPFRDSQSGDLRRLRFDTVVELADIADTAQVLIRASGMPILVEQKVGESSVLFFTSAADREWSQWTQSRLYVPLVRQMTAYQTRQLADRQAVIQKQLGEEFGSSVQNQPGIMEQEEGQTVVWNVDADESLLTRASDEDFRLALGLTQRDRDAVLAEFGEQIGIPEGAERANERWDLIVWMLFGLLTAELFLASRVHA